MTTLPLLTETAHPALNARALRYLHEIALHGGVRAAAEVLGINASVISRQVAQLEKSHEVVLLEKRGRGVMLSEIGWTLVGHFRENCRRDADMLSELAQFRGLQRGRVAIGVGEGFIENLLAKALHPFSQSFPDIVVDLRGGSSADILTMLRNDEVDIGICAGGSEDPGMQSRAFRTAPFSALVAPGHPLAGAGRIRLQALQGERLIFMPERFGAQQFLAAMMRAEQLHLSPAYRCDLFSAAQAIAAAGLGVAFMSTDAARHALSAGRLIALEISHPLAQSFNGQTLRRIGRRQSPAAAFLWRQIGDAMQGMNATATTATTLPDDRTAVD